MAGNQAVLTSLGLDTSQYQDGISIATKATQIFLGTFSGISDIIKQIPVIGQVWEATAGKIVDGFVDMELASRDFARIMSTDVSKSLEGTLDQLTEVQKLIKQKKEFNFATDIVLPSAAFAGALFGRPQDAMAAFNTYKKELNDLGELEGKRTELLTHSVELFNLQAKAQSAVYSGSQQITEEERLRLDVANKRLKVEAEIYENYGPEKSRTDEKRIEADDHRARLLYQIQKFSDAETKSIQTRAGLLKEQNEYLEKSADISATGLAVDQAILNTSKAQNDLDAARYIGIQEEIEAAETRLKISETEQENAIRENQLREQLLKGEARISDLRIRGATAYAIKLEEIKQRYLGPLDEALRHSDTAAINSLTSRQANENIEAETENRRVGQTPGGRIQEHRNRVNSQRQERISKANIDQRQKDEEAGKYSPMGNLEQLGQGYSDSDPTNNPTRPDLSPLGNPRNTGPGTGIDKDIKDRLKRGGVGDDSSKSKSPQSSTVSQSSFDSTMREIVDALKGANK